MSGGPKGSLSPKELEVGGRRLPYLLVYYMGDMITRENIITVQYIYYNIFTTENILLRKNIFAIGNI